VLKIAATVRRGSFALDVQIDVATPGIIALFGRSGCGKTTLISVVAGLLRAEHAVVNIDGIVLEDTARRIRTAPEQRRIGYVFQDSRLFPHMSVLANLQYGERRAPSSERRIGLEKVIELLDLQVLLRRRPRDLSGGERQRVALGRALLSQPRLLLLDEPLASLDVARREEVLPYLESLRDEFSMPMIYVSHQFDEVMRLASHIVLLDKGRVLTQGGVEQISLHPELRAIVGDESIGAVVTGTIAVADPVTGLAAVRVGGGVINVSLLNARPGAQVRVQVLARDVILATHALEGVSVRNMLEGKVVQIAADDAQTDLVHVDVGGAVLLARVTRAASTALHLHTGMSVWALVKAVSIRGHVFGVRKGTEAVSDE
jgi:molybdate transport system ATP-binding protein